MRRFRGLVSSEAVALVSVLCIAALLLGAYYQREMDRNDQQALKVAQKVYQVLAPPPASRVTAPTTPTTAQPPTPSLREKLDQGIKSVFPVKVELLEDDPQAWKVLVWHPQGVVRYLVTPQGVKQEVR